MNISACISLAAALAVSTVTSLLTMAHADSYADRGKYLVTLGLCNDCHTPGYFFGKPDMAHFLGGSDVAFEIPGLGAFSGRNITPDRETGIGNWTSEQIVTALQIGKRPDGSTLAPIMPWHAFANLSKDDVMAIAAFLKSVPPVRHEVAGPFRPGERVTTFLYRILPPDPVLAPGAIFPGQVNNQFLDVLVNSRSAGTPPRLRFVEFASNGPSVPRRDGAGPGGSRHFAQCSPA